MGLTLDCFTPSELVDLHSGLIPGRTNRTEADAHVRACSSCRDAYRRLAATAVTHLQGWLNQELVLDHCPERAMLAAYAQGSADAVEKELVESHVEECADCATELATRSQTLLQRMSDLTERWAGAIQEQIALAIESVRPPQLCWGFAETKDAAPVQVIEFIGSAARVQVWSENDVARLLLEHPDWPAGTLVELMASDPSGGSIWRRFVVLREGMSMAVSEVCLDGVDLTGSVMAIRAVDPAALADSDADQLIQGVLAAERDDPVSLDGWVEVGRRIQLVRGHTGLQRVANVILETCTA